MASAKIPALSLLFALGFASLVALGACKGDGSESEPAGDESAGASEEAEAHTYTVRGRVEVLPTGDQPRIQIFHEEVPDFVNQKGEVSTMAAMSMPFGVADDVSLDDIEEGDLIEFTFEVDWDHPDVSRVIAIEELPEDTEIDLQ